MHMAAGEQQETRVTRETSQAKKRFTNLGVRLVSSILLAALTLAALFGGFPFWPLLVLTVGMGLAWEWNRMLARSGTPAALTLLVALAIVVGLAAFGQPAIAAVVAVVGAVVLAAIGSGVGRLTHAAGLLYFGLPSTALLWLQADLPAGALAVLLVMTVVWVTDSAAYFTGRAVGGPKLWPSVSPNKTWAGSLGGAAASVVAGVIFAATAGSTTLAWIAVLSLVLSVACQGGDLLESALKRRFDRKDTSGLIPGHGGLMDRLDGLLMSALVAALCGLWWTPDRPSATLLPGLTP
jgi:phosphatidate cytidylyltransferase